MLSRCNKCGRPIEWISYKDKRIAIDPRPETYRSTVDGWIRADASVVHSAVCPSEAKPAAAVPLVYKHDES